MKFTILSLLCVTVVAMSNANGISITPWEHQPSRALFPRGVSGIRDCGAGAATFIDVRLDGCAAAPCTLTRGQQVNLAIDFRSRDQHWDLTVRSALRKEAQLSTLQEDYRIPDSTVDPGVLYTFNFPFTVQADFTGASQFRLKLYQNYVHEICLILPVNIV